MRAPLTILLLNAKSMSFTGLVGYSSSSEEGEDDKETEAEALDTGGGHLTASKCKDTATSISPSPSPPPSKRRCHEPSLVATSSTSKATDSQSIKSPLPLPSSILDMFSEQEEVEKGVESVAHHDGRVRSFPHVRGNWPTHVYIPIDLTDEIKTCLMTFGSNIDKYFQGHTLNLLPLSELHVSLSRTVPIQHHYIEPLVSALRSNLKGRTPFLVHLSGLAVYVNDDKTRSFIGLEVNKGHQELVTLVHAVNRCFSHFRLSEFYQSPSFHVSVFWCLGNILTKLPAELIEKVKQSWDSHLFEQTTSQTSLIFTVSEVRMKCGNKLYSLPLSES